MGDNALRVNGSDIGAHGRGINVLEINRSGDKIRTDTFDVYGSPSTETQNLIDFIDGADTGNPLLFAENDHAGNITDPGVTRIEELGSTEIKSVQDDGRSNWAFICVKGLGPLSEKFASSGNGPVTTTHDLPDSMDVQNTGTIEADLNEVGPAAESLVGWWPLDGNVRDHAGSSDGTSNGATKAGGLGQGSYDFERSNNDYVDLGVLSDECAFGNGDFTFSAWVRFESVNSNATIFELSRYTDSVLIRPNNGNLQIYIDNGSDDRLFAPSITSNAGEWYHFVVTRRNGNTVEVYEDGQSLGTNSGMNGDMVINQESYIGMSVHNTGQAHDGEIQDVRLYDRDLTDAEVQALYNLTDPRTGQQVIESQTGEVYAKNQFDGTL